MLNVCNGSSKENWCWITNETRQDAHFDEPFRSNLAAISSPSQQPPFASHGQYSTDFRLKQAMDPEIHNRDRPTSWVSWGTCQRHAQPIHHR
ncbi:MAG: hypothetical protein H6988_09180 [Pseudomonadales bacterium]|nr:hypothetical protein [Pseudomonadales bacterium]